METIPNEVYIVSGITLFALFVSGFILIIITLYQKRQKLHRLEKNKLHQQFHEELLHTQLEIQEQTLKHISQEIHDNIGQTLSLVKLNLNTINLDKKNTLEEKILNSKELVSKAISDLRSLSKSLNTDTILASGLMKAINFELQLIEKAGTFKTLFNIEGEVQKLDAKKELILFRLVQEALNNCIKHSGAQCISISANYTSTQLILIIEDNGKGFDYDSKAIGVEHGSGLHNMCNRAHVIGGKCDISSTENGTSIKITLPID
jgi:signal transduction histidine kinase